MLSVVVLVLLLTSCLDDDDDQATNPLPVAYVSIYHESPDAPLLDISVDDRPVNRLEFTDYTGYLNFYTGDRNFKINSFNATNTLVDTTMNFVDGGFYSLFIVNNLTNVETLAVRDSSATPGSGKAKVRFINLSPDAPALDVIYGDSASALFAGQVFKTSSDFVEVDANASSFAIKIAGGNDELVSVSDINIREGAFYTIITRGFVTPPSGNNNALSIEVVKN
jgi:hypothetical protein